MDKLAPAPARKRADIVTLFEKAFGGPPDHVAATPGRVNLIGEHTDYSDGWVLPMALDREVFVAVRRRDDARLHMISADYAEESQWSLKELTPRPGKAWSNYVAAAIWALGQEGYHLSGADILIAGDIPQGAGLSSSAALEVCAARAICALGGWAWDPVAMALLAQKAENDFIGMRCGIMDQMAVAAAEPGCALLLNCKQMKFESIPVAFKDAVFVVVDSAVKRELKGSAYNDRRKQCEEALAQLLKLDKGLLCLSDGNLELLARAGSPDAVWHRRARHVLTENARVYSAVVALRAGDAPAFGKLMDASHESLRSDFEVSCPQLDVLTGLARNLPGVHGSRLTGAGFGGCTVSLVDKANVDGFEEKLLHQYKVDTGLDGKVYRIGPGKPARVI